MAGKKQLLIDEANNLGIPADSTWKVADIREAIANKTNDETEEVTEKPPQEKPIIVIKKPKKYKALCNVGGKYMPGTILTVGREISEADERMLLNFNAIEEVDE